MVVNPWDQAQIDKSNRYLRAYGTYTNPTVAQKNTYNQIVGRYNPAYMSNGRIDPNKFTGDANRHYRQVNPMSKIAEDSRMKYQNSITDKLRNGQSVSAAQMAQYKDTASKYNLKVYNEYQDKSNQYQDQLDQANKPIDFDKYKTETGTIADLAKKYGFDYSREYAARQAEAEAQAKRNANADAQNKNKTGKEENLKSIDNNLMNMADSLDRNYYQKGLQQAQGQVESGLTGGIAADQDLRMAMSRQADMGSAYRDANLGRMQENNRFTNDDLRLASELGLINQEAIARTDSLYNDRLQQGFENVMTDANFRQSENQRALDLAVGNRQNAVDTAKFGMGHFQDAAQWNSEQKAQREQWASQQKTQQEQWRKEFDQGKIQWETDAKWQHYMDEKQFNNLSAAEKAQNKLAYDQMQQEKAQFGSEQAWRKYQYSHMSAAEKTQFDQNSKQFGETMAWNKYELEYTSKMSVSEAQAAAGGLAGIP